MPNTSRRLLELVAIYVLVPISFTWPYPIWLKTGIGFIGFVAIAIFLYKNRGERTSQLTQSHRRWFRNRLLILLSIILPVSITYVFWLDPSWIFGVVLEKPKLWLLILFVYSFLSVYPQELIYRTFFFQRYGSLFPNQTALILVNAAVFSLAHLFFQNHLVTLLTFIGGILFAITYHKTKSTALVSIEHAIYGCWLFTVGMGDMLAFPS